MKRYTNIAVNISQQDLALAYRIDVALQPSVARARRWNRALTKAGHRRYLAKDGYITPAQPSYTQGVYAFAEAVYRRVQSLNLSEEDMKKPFNPAMAEIGYTCNCEGRLREHRSHRCSNRLMNLFEAVCMVLFGNRYRIRQFVIYLVWEPDQAAVAEMIFTILVNGFVGQGAGFTFCNPGISVASARKVSVKRWTEFAAWTIHQSPYLKNGTAEDLRLLQEQEREQSLVADLAKVRADIQQIETELEREDGAPEVQAEAQAESSTCFDAIAPWILTYHAAAVQRELQK
ncbi:hypothetical protein BCR34DRAFT_600886 [Clohesyomyces aquaticus]|uniref:Uncharacterized protein n=1 Tax=Clohesyomyces aquaticus TaxID=1231657 RepID=A0A1Y1ZPH9_9PLEO|nr:hypothetical protein BCR34DRAFT_600886 [Clohesyomyces aquaticus]